MIPDEFKYEAGFNVPCEKCGKMTNLLLLEIQPGAKCKHCGAELTLNAALMASKDLMISMLSGRDDVKIG